MRSSTSSSEARQDRTWPVLLGWLGLTLAVAAVRPAQPAGAWSSQRSDAFWISKLDWACDCELLVAGDSRAVFAIDASQLGEAMGVRAKNFGFNGLSLTDQYLEALAAKLDRSGVSQRRIVLAITPRSLCGGLQLQNEFRIACARTSWDRFRVVTLGPRMEQLRPISLSELRGWLKRTDTDTSRFTFDPSGSIVAQCRETEWAPPAPWSAPATHAPSYVGTVADHVARWTSQGVRVYVVRIPTRPDVDEREDEIYRFDPAEARARLEAAGAVWLELPSAQYATWDSSHYTAESERRFTRALAAAIAAREGSTAPTPSTESISSESR